MKSGCYDINDEFLNEEVSYIPTTQILDYPNSPFKVFIDKDLMELAESIKRIGVVMPVVVKWIGNGKYQMISGHRRKMATEIAGIHTLPCIVRDLSDDEAAILMVDSNIQREEILPSEKAFAYKIRLDAMKRKAGRPKKNNYVPLAHNFETKTSRQQLSELVGESEDQIRRYIRLTELIPSILEMVDEKMIALRPAVELSYLSEKSQETLVDIMECNDCTPSHAQAIRLRRLEETNKFSYDKAMNIMDELKGNQKIQFRIPKEKISRYFAPNTSDKDIEETIIKALELYKRIQINKSK